MAHFDNMSINPESEDYDRFLASLQQPQMSIANAPPSIALPGSASPDDDEDTSRTVQNFIAKKNAPPADADNASSAPPVANPGFPAGMDMGALKDAQDVQNSTNQSALIGKAATQLGAGIAGAPQVPGTPVYDAMLKNAGLPTEQLQERQNLFGQNLGMKEKVGGADPNSFQSQFAQKIYGDAIKGMGGDPSITKGMSAQELGQFQKVIETGESLQTKKIAMQQMMEYRQGMLENRNTQQENTRDFRANQAILNRMRGDKTLNDSISKATNLQNALNNIEATGKITAQDMADVQAIAIQNMGVGGSSSVGERAERYAKSLGIKGTEALQFLTGTPQDIGKDNPLFQRYKQIINMEIQNFGDRARKHVDALSSGNESMLERHPEYKADLANAKSALLGQLPQSSSPQGYSDPGKEKRYQEWKAKQ